MNLKRIQKVTRVAVINSSEKLPFTVLRTVKGENGERVVEGVKPFVDSLPSIPFGKVEASGEYRAFSKEERIALADSLRRKEERAAKKAAKASKPAKPTKEKEKTRTFAEAMAHIAASQVGSVPERTVQRDGRWVQVGKDNLSAFIEAR